MADDEQRPRFAPPSADPPRYGVAGLPEYAPTPPQQRPRTASVAGLPVGEVTDAPTAHPAAHAGANYSATDPGIAQQRVSAAPPEPSNGYAVTSLVLSVIAIGLLVVSIGVFSPLALPFGVAGWLVGAAARKRPGEASMAQTGYVMGIVGTALSIVAIVVWGALIVAL